MRLRAADLVEVVATNTINGATRAIVLTAHLAQPGLYIVELTAYDSAHPHDFLLQAARSGPVLDFLLEAAREDGARTFERDGGSDSCDCWAHWDPHCGRTGCWGVYKPTAAR